ncbi:DUF3284 domain-containing protein [Candidatus Enterococcus clewellii]|uniref:DUF3284 domain-containing protein n=1 Tax=Candidatus Enterococcus clewellii TaxID=1834193 RepID=A0A242K2S8_9ENTE|nr:DUF3284 domain-containing protein [Enterococcus sp. 9E7_DIV0242]OTP12898.1 hypothetical protein A5888_003480 [Enterococcus sp. 9E7_DIV0242]
MEIVKKLNVPATYFFDKVIESILFDVNRSTGKKMKPMQLNNFEYVKEFSKNSRAKIKIEKLVENETYAYRTSTVKNEYFAQYTVKPVDENSCEVHYTEKMESFGTLQKMNDAVVGMLIGFLKKRQFKKMLQQIESSY